MHFTTPLLLTLASVAWAQQSEIDFAGDVPGPCQQDPSCEAAIYPAAQCPRNMNFRWPDDDNYLDCLSRVPNFCTNLGQCYQCVGTYKKEGDIKRMWQICNTF